MTGTTAKIRLEIPPEKRFIVDVWDGEGKRVDELRSFPTEEEARVFLAKVYPHLKVEP